MQKEEKATFLIILNYFRQKSNKKININIINPNPEVERPKFAKNPLLLSGGPCIGFSFKKLIRNFWNYK